MPDRLFRMRWFGSAAKGDHALGIIGANAVHSGSDEAGDVGVAVGGPGDEPPAGAMELVHQCLIDHDLVLPEHGSAGGSENRKGIDQPGVEQDAAAERAIALTEPPNDTVIEGMHGVAFGLGTGVQGAEQDGIEVLLDPLHLDPDVHAAEKGEHLAQEGHRLTIGEMVLLDHVEGQVADPALAFEGGPVMDHDGAVPGSVDIELDALGAQSLGPAEGGATVFVLVAGCTTVSDAERSSHEIRMSGRTTITARKRSLLHPI